ncbi:hypothetical protein FA13DRAFT_1789211 [Coprinellus micaceus]|uniref:Uncharacterized protein n=1 Tax=Coprinellus micaceus TaxID=71717 RepID=A0A4Y7TKI0_COPMI|nr:hypothetical protein FA13DRAFT_1789211 [Coprinellus micaceus]
MAATATSGPADFRSINPFEDYGEGYPVPAPPLRAASTSSASTPRLSPFTDNETGNTIFMPNPSSSASRHNAPASFEPRVAATATPSTTTSRLGAIASYEGGASAVTSASQYASSPGPGFRYPSLTPVAGNDGGEVTIPDPVGLGMEATALAASPPSTRSTRATTPSTSMTNVDHTRVEEVMPETMTNIVPNPAPLQLEAEVPPINAFLGNYTECFVMLLSPLQAADVRRDVGGVGRLVELRIPGDNRVPLIYSEVGANWDSVSEVAIIRILPSNRLLRLVIRAIHNAPAALALALTALFASSSEGVALFLMVLAWDFDCKSSPL